MRAAEITLLKRYRVCRTKLEDLEEKYFHPVENT